LGLRKTTAFAIHEDRFAIFLEVLGVPGFWEIFFEEFVGPSVATIEAVWILMGSCNMGFYATDTGRFGTIGTCDWFAMGLFGEFIEADWAAHFC
jgi:hypothetical protein